MKRYNSPEIKAYLYLDETRIRVKNFVNSFEKKNAVLEIRSLYSELESDLMDVEKKISNGRLRVGILGGRGSGKSTLANAIIGLDILPKSALIFCTSIPTSIIHGSKYKIHVKSKIPNNSILKTNTSEAEIKSILNLTCKESNNRNNIKEITSITVSVPKDHLQSLEFIDVPGFTQGNKMHQAFAERYVSYYCDLCLVLVNNPDSIKIGRNEGLDALAKSFYNRSESTIFLINQCDITTFDEVEELKYYFKSILKNYPYKKSPIIHNISAKNSLEKIGNRYNFDDLLRNLINITSKKYIFMAHASMVNFSINLNSIKTLCTLELSELVEVEKELKNILYHEIAENVNNLKNNKWSDHKKTSYVNTSPSFINYIEIPKPIEGEPVLSYKNRVLDAIVNKRQIINSLIETHQLELFERYDDVFKNHVSKLDYLLKKRVLKFERKFGIKNLIKMPELSYEKRFSTFEPELIEELKPSKLKGFIEKHGGKLSVLSKEINFMNLPISFSISGIQFPIGLPIGFKSSAEIKEEYAKEISEKSIMLINKYLLEVLEKQGTILNEKYTKSLDNFSLEWENCLKYYIKKCELAKGITSQKVVSDLEKMIHTINADSSKLRNFLLEK